MLTAAEIEGLLERVRSGTLTLDQQRELSFLLCDVPPAPPAIPFTDFVAEAKPDYRWWEWNTRLAARLQDVADGKIRRLMVFCPPRYGKSELTSKLFPAYYQYRFPIRRVGLSAYGEDRAHEYLSHAQEYYLRVGGKLRSLRDAGLRRGFEVEGRGGMWAAGLNGALPGLGFHLGIIDDPLKNMAEAASKVIQSRNIKWYNTTYYSRREPNDAIILITTRWHPRDLAGQILEQERINKDDEGALENWHIVIYDETRDEKEPYDLPDNCSLEPDWRKHGELLCPERWPESEVKKNRAKGTYSYSTVYQQRPKTSEGTRFKAEWFPTVDAMPVDVTARVRYWDLAGTDEPSDEDSDPDWTVGFRVSRGRQDQIIYFEKMKRFRKKPGGRNATMRETAEADAREFGSEEQPNRHAVVQWWEGESGVDGGDRNKALGAALAGHICKFDRPIASKEMRHEVLAGQAEVGNVRLVEPKRDAHGNLLDGEEDWIPTFLDEMTSVPFGAHDDIADAASDGTAKVLDAPEPILAEIVTVELKSPFAL
jgi:hypothetical protein